MARQTGLVLCAAIAALWAASFVRTFGWYDGRPGATFWWLGLEAGCLGIGVADADGFGSPPNGYWRVERRRGPMLWRPEFERFSGSSRMQIPLWLPFIAVATVTVPLCWSDMTAWWRRRRNSRRGKCGACGYDLTGIAIDAVCPECGTARATPITR